MRRFFISYVFEDREFMRQLLGWAEQGALGKWKAEAESEDLRREGAGKIRGYLSPMIQACEAVVLLVGDNSHNHPWIDYEVQNARSAGKRIIVARIPKTFGGAPVGVHEPMIPFAPDSIRDALPR